MMRETMTIRTATMADVPRLVEIYGYYVENTAISFEYDIPSVEEFSNRVQKTLKNYPYLVVEEDGKVWGFVYGGAFVGRAAYRHSCELTIYLDYEARGRGYGRKLYETMEELLKAQGILNLYVCVADPIVEDEYLTKNSERFHTRLGFSKIGVFHKCGYKFNRWYNIIWMEKIIGEHL